jgi:AGCS family alanine or glycine:cation symporter
MNDIFAGVNRFFEVIVPITDFMWEFPTNYAWYADIPVIGKLSFVIMFLLGAGLYFTLKTGFVQIRRFGAGMHIMLTMKASEMGVSPMAAFLLSSSMRIGPGNIMGVTGAISIGGPGALFWMWVSASVGMATAFAEAVLAQIFKEKSARGFVGGMPFYGQKLFGDRRIVGIFLACIFIVYALFNIPGQSFHMLTATSAVAETLTGHTFERSSLLYVIVSIVLIVVVTSTVFGGLRRVTKVTDVMVPIMAGVYTLVALMLIALNYTLIPYFFEEVITGAFSPHALFGGAFGVALAQGIKRGLLSNEAGQGTITIAAAVSENNHPCEQGFIQAIGVFLDTIIICSMTGFMVVMAHLWTGDSGVAWESIRDSKITVFLGSVQHLVPGTALDNTVTIIVSLCYALFSFTTLIGLILFAEIAGNQISRNTYFIQCIRAAGALLFVPFGCLSVLAGLELGNLWYISDFVNLMVVLANVPLLFIGSKYVLGALAHYNRTGGARFVSREIGLETEVWK